jgi:hypothetical protein
MKKLGLLTLITCSIALLSASLFYWIGQQTNFQIKLISTNLDQNSYKVGTAINIKTLIKLPLQCNYEVAGYELEEGLKEHETGVYFTRDSINQVTLHESLFAIRPGEYKNNHRTLVINSPKGRKDVHIHYPAFTVKKRELDLKSSPKSFGEINLDQPPRQLSVLSTLCIITFLSLIITLVFLKKLPQKKLTPKESFVQALQQILLYDENSTSSPLMIIQDQIRSLLAHLHGDSFLHAPIEELAWEKLSENDTQMLRSYLERIFTARFHKNKIPKDEFQDMVRELITWANELKNEERK